MTWLRSRLTAEILLIAILVAVHLGMAVMSSSQTSDDAFISFRYARNLVEGNGLVFNLGERVEGYTNFLWVVVLSLFIPFFDPILVSKFLGVACNVLLIMSIWLFCKRNLGKLAWIPPVYVALDPAILRWGTRGLETSLFTLLLWLALVFAVSEKRCAASTGFMAAIATMTRPEGFLAATIIFISRISGLPLFRYYASEKYIENDYLRKHMLSYWSGYGVLILPYLAWKLYYYGDILPNTFYAKTDGGVFKLWRGLAYITNGWSWPELILGIGLCWAIVSRRSTLATRTVSFTGLFFTVYIVWAGGDSLGLDRFLAPV
ncbi:hypothetical protein K8T06_14620, partial [bacterium]|nr:hypothetical protein [bacterium]